MEINYTNQRGMELLVGAEFTNHGALRIGNNGSVGNNGIFSQGTITNESSGSIFIDNTTSHALEIYPNGSMVHRGLLRIGYTADIGGMGLVNFGSFNSSNSGTTSVDRVNSNAIANAGSFTNFGGIKIGENGPIGNYAIYNQEGSFVHDGGCDTGLEIYDGHILDAGDSFINNGVIIQDSDGVSNIAQNNILFFYSAGTVTVGSGSAPIQLSESFAGNRVWTGCNNGDWANPNNWYPKELPTSSSGAFVNIVFQAPFISASTTANCKFLDWSGGSSLNVDGTLTVAEGGLDLPGDFTVNNNGNITVDGGMTIGDNATLYNDGTLTVNNGEFVMGNNAHLTNPFASTLTVADGNMTLGNTVVLDNIGDISVNQGTFEMGSGGSITNDGFLIIGLGGLHLNSGVTAQGDGYYSLNGSIEGNGTFMAGVSTVIMIGDENITIGKSATYYTLICNVDATVNLGPDAETTCNNDFTVFKGEFKNNYKPLTCGDVTVFNGATLDVSEGSTLTANGSLTIKSGGHYEGSARIGGDLVNDGTSNFRVLYFIGDGISEVFSSPITCSILELDKDFGSEVLLHTDITITGANLLGVVMEGGNLNLNGHNVEILNNNRLWDDGNSRRIISSNGGEIFTTNTNAFNHPGWLGVRFGNTSELGDITVRRMPTAQPSVNGEPSIERTYVVATETNPGSSIQIEYEFQPAELNGLEMTDLAPYRYDEATSTWVQYPVTASQLSQNYRYVATTTSDPSGTWTLGLTGGVLPVEMTYFSVIKSSGETLLTWQTATEINNEGFEIEHSTDGKHWDYIDFINGYGTTTETRDYTFTHKSPSAGVNYYRLRQLDFDGQFEYSEIRSVDFGGNSGVIKVFPNPATHQVNIQLPEGFEQMSVQVFDASGKVIFTRRLERGDGLPGINVSEWKAGFYVLRIQVDGQSSTQKLQVF